MIGIIYMYTSPSNKKYIGQTINEKSRRNAFMNINHVYSEGKKLENARKKYEPINFIYEQLEILEEEDKLNLILKLNDLEQFYINKYDTFKSGYNSTLGGNVSFLYTKDICDKISQSKSQPILQYDLDGFFIKKWNSCREISEEFNCSTSTIRKCCKGVAKKSLGYLWKYYSEDFPLTLDVSFSEREKLVSSSYNTRNIINGSAVKSVLKYNLYGNFIKEYSSIKEALRENDKANAINDSCVQRIKTSGGYIWRYKLTNDYPLSIDVSNITEQDLIRSTLNKKGEKPVNQYDLNGNFITSYESITKAANTLGIQRTGIYKCCQNKGKTCNNYIWKYANQQNSI